MGTVGAIGNRTPNVRLGMYTGSIERLFTKASIKPRKQKEGKDSYNSILGNGTFSSRYENHEDFLETREASPKRDDLLSLKDIQARLAPIRTSIPRSDDTKLSEETSSQIISSAPSLTRIRGRKEVLANTASSKKDTNPSYEAIKAKFEQLKQKRPHLPSAHTIFSLLSSLKMTSPFGLPTFQK